VSMRPRLIPSIALLLLVAILPICAIAQSEEEVSLGDVARSVRKTKVESKAESQAKPAEAVIDNDNLSGIMEEAEAHRLQGRLVFSIDAAGTNFEMKSPDGTCSLSFDAKATALVSAPYVPQDLPENEVMKLDGPATIDDGMLQVSVFNPTGWNLTEITVGLTMVRHEEKDAAYDPIAKLLPAADEDLVPAEKHSDLTVLYHLKGVAAPLSSAVFREALGLTPVPGQEWHWAIVQAQGIPPAAAKLGKR
jgi:hypothetical protein